MTIINKIIQYVKNYTFSRQWKKRQRGWQKTINVPKETKFCPLLYKDCTKPYDHDSNCFLTKAPGCTKAKLYIQNKKPSAHITREYCLEYLINHA